MRSPSYCKPHRQQQKLSSACHLKGFTRHERFPSFVNCKTDGYLVWPVANLFGWSALRRQQNIEALRSFRATAYQGGHVGILGQLLTRPEALISVSRLSDSEGYPDISKQE